MAARFEDVNGSEMQDVAARFEDVNSSQMQGVAARFERVGGSKIRGMGSRLVKESGQGIPVRLCPSIAQEWGVAFLDKLDIVDLKLKAVQIRKDLLTLIHRAKAGHTGGSLSNTDILTALYYRVMNIDPANPQWEERDRFILSKGHSVESLWCILADRGFFPREELATYSQFGTRLIGHPNNKVPGVEMNTGALGHGLSVSVGMALAAKRDGKRYRVFCLMGDGEQEEGSVWEAAMAGAHYRLDNLVAIIDRNGLQISGGTEDVMSLEPLDEKWCAFGWHVTKADGHDMEALVRIFESAPQVPGKPTLVLAKTVKGRGVSFAENAAGWHHRVPTDGELARALAELSAQEEQLKREKEVAAG